ATLGALIYAAPPYLAAQGFPADDAWTHSVYGRSLAETGQLAFNPGAPAAGVTSPAWACVLGAVHAIAPAGDAPVLVTKLLGFTLHVATALLVRGTLQAPGVGLPERLLGACLVAAHPTLVAASVSGLEVPLAALAACGLWSTSWQGRPWRHAAVSLAAALVRA